MATHRTPKHQDYVKNRVKYSPLTLTPGVPLDKNDVPNENETKMNQFYLSEHAAGKPVRPNINPMIHARFDYNLPKSPLFNDRRKGKK
jgi:hypothetical protein